MSLLFTAPLRHHVLAAAVACVALVYCVRELGADIDDTERRPRATIYVPNAVVLSFGAAFTAVAALLYILTLYAAQFGELMFNHGRNLLRSVRVTERHGGELVVEVLKAHGVKHLLTLIGGHISPVVVAAAASGIRVIDVRHEVTAVFAADAIARLTGIPGVAIVTAGPGLTNTLTAVKNASMAESPVVLISGAAATLTAGRGALQDIDQMSLMRSVCKMVISVKRVRDIVPALRTAFATAASGVPGPVFLELPIDVLYPVMEVQANLGMVQRMRVRDLAVVGERDAIGALRPDAQAAAARVILPQDGPAAGADVTAYLRSRGRPDAPVFLRPDGSKKGNGFIVDAYLNASVRDLFGDGFTDLVHAEATGDRSAFAPLPVSIPRPAASSIASAAALLRKAQRPVLLIASQAMLFDPLQRAGGVRDADALVAAITRLGIPVYAGGMARGVLGREHPLLLRQNRKLALREADVIILAGSVCDFRLDYGRALSRKARIISINRSKSQLYLNSDLFWSPALAAIADPGLFLTSLAAQVDADLSQRVTPWLERLKSEEARTESANASKADVPAYGHDARAGQRLINPLKLLQALDSSLPDNSILIGDGGDFVATAAYVVRPRGPLKWLDPGAFGTLGVGLGFAIGAALVHPDAEIWLLWGDGSVGYSVAEYDTCRRHGLAIHALVGNDAAWSQIEREQVPILGASTACTLAYTPYEDVATGYGGRGWLLQAHDGNFAATFAEARRAARVGDGVPVLVNALIGKSDFREGSISV